MKDYSQIVGTLNIYICVHLCIHMYLPSVYLCTGHIWNSRLGSHWKCEGQFGSICGCKHFNNIKRCPCFGLWFPSPRFPVAFSVQVVGGHVEVQWAKLLMKSRTTLCQGFSRRVGWENQVTKRASWQWGLQDNLGLFPEDSLVDRGFLFHQVP